SNLSQRGGGILHRAYNDILHTKDRYQSLTAGSNQIISPRLTNELRFNISESHSDLFDTIDNFAGAVAPPDRELLPISGSQTNGFFACFAHFAPNGLAYEKGKNPSNPQHQRNV